MWDPKSIVTLVPPVKNTPSVDEGVPLGLILGRRVDKNSNNKKFTVSTRDKQTTEASDIQGVKENTTHVLDIPKSGSNIEYSMPVSRVTDLLRAAITFLRRI